MCATDVAPRGGTRIEMFSVAPVTVGSLVAPRGGARIEISPTGEPCEEVNVAPRGGARIEIYIANEALSIIESPLVEGRELK